MTAENTPKPISLWKLLLPLTIGIGASAYLINKMDLAALHSVTFSEKLVLWLFIAALTVIGRDFAFMYKLRLSSGNHMNWKKTFQTIAMWEFCACITPKVSEAPFVLFVLKQSGLSYGKSIAVLMLNSFLDNMAFIVMWTLLYLALGSQMLNLEYACPELAGMPVLQTLRGFAVYAWVGYFLILAVCVFLAVALFVMPHATKQLFHRIAALPLLSRFEKSIAGLGDEVEITASEFKGMPLSFWIKMSVATFVNWICRYLLAIALLYAFAVTDFSFVTALARQYVLWIYTGIPTTPGAVGVAEVSFTALNCEFAPHGLAAAIGLIWRLYSYYFYIGVGLLILPKWAKQLAARQS